MAPSSVHFNGSVNLPDATTVMREICARIPEGVRRIPDGEPGERGYWVSFQGHRFSTMPGLRLVHTSEPFEAHGVEVPALPLYALAEGVGVDALNWPDLGYADAYIESYEVFHALQDEGTIPADARFQVQYPTPLAVVLHFFESDAAEILRSLFASYERALFADLDKLLAAIPHERCAVQWDVAFEFDLLEMAAHPHKDVPDPATRRYHEMAFGPGMPTPADEVAASLARCVDRVPADVPVGLHLCYGDFAHEHVMQPDSLALQVDLLNAVAAAAGRPVAFCSITVPQNQRDPAFFAPLREVQPGTETELAFGIVPYHPADQAPGVTVKQVELIDAALAASPGGSREWAVCTECGMGRVVPEEIPTLLDIHRQILEQHLA